MNLLVDDTVGRRKKSLYNPYLSRNEIRLMELACIKIAKSDLNEGELPINVCHVRRFYKRFADPIGASEGAKTNFILVQYSYTGEVHGYPVTEDYLRRQGANL